MYFINNKKKRKEVRNLYVIMIYCRSIFLLLCFWWDGGSFFVLYE